jgi:hypothetical protein
MTTIPRREWTEFCTDFTLHHRGWLASIAVARGGKESPVVEGEPIRAISTEMYGGDEIDKLLISTGDDPLSRTIHVVEKPAALVLEEQEDVLWIESSDGTVTRLRLRSAPGKR